MTIQRLFQLIENAKKIVFFGGAGVSTESGLKDFRSKDGLYSNNYKGYSVEYILSHDFFTNHTEDFFNYYRQIFINNDNIRPNFAHLYLAKLEQEGKDITIVTQNIDGLHQMAGSKKVLELHGSIHRNYSVLTHEEFPGLDIFKNEGIPKNKNGEIIRPDVTLYGESLNERIISEAIKSISNADLLIIAGTSLTVYPAANFINYFKGDNIVAINRDYIPIKNFLKGSVGEIFKQLDEFKA